MQGLPTALTGHHWARSPRGLSVPMSPLRPTGSALGRLPGEPLSLVAALVTCCPALAYSCPPGPNLHFLGEKIPR